MIEDIEKYTDKIFKILETVYGYSKHQECTPYIVFLETKEGDSKGEYCHIHNEIILYKNNIKDIEELTRTLIHEYQHYLQSPTWMTRYYRKGHSYCDHPYEIQAYKEEENWKTIWEQVL